MEYKRNYRSIRKAGDIGIALLASFLITFLGILGLSFSLLVFPVSERVVDIGILILYILSCFVAGRIIRKRTWNKRFLWGLLIGDAYYLILVLMSVMCGSITAMSVKDVITSLVICGVSAALGCGTFVTAFRKSA